MCAQHTLPLLAYRSFALTQGTLALGCAALACDRALR